MLEFTTLFLVQRALKLEFAHGVKRCCCPVLPRIIDTDKVMVLSKGELIQFDTPAALLRDKAGYFVSIKQL